MKTLSEKIFDLAAQIAAAPEDSAQHQFRAAELARAVRTLEIQLNEEKTRRIEGGKQNHGNPN